MQQPLREAQGGRVVQHRGCPLMEVKVDESRVYVDQKSKAKFRYRYVVVAKKEKESK